MEVMMMNSSSSADVAWRLGRIMLKYRPIAPKPVSASAGAITGGGGGGGSTAPAVENCRGKKRKRAAPVGGGRRTRRGRKAAEKQQQQQQQHSAAITTLPLMPETPERKEEEPATPAGSASQASSPASASADGAPAVVAPRPVRPVWSSVTVETVTDAWWDGGEPFGYDLLDACPAFVSDGLGGVVWANEAYRRMVGGGTGEEARVALETEGVTVPAGVRCFACRVRVRYACRSGGKVSVVVPCDVWRLADGRRMVWRLDVKAALTLSSLS